MGSFGKLSKIVRARRGCNCCFTSKPIDAPLGPCQGCIDAGCTFSYGNWFRGNGKNKDGTPNGKPICPARERSKKGGAGRRAKYASEG